MKLELHTPRHPASVQACQLTLIPASLGDHSQGAQVLAQFTPMAKTGRTGEITELAEVAEDPNRGLLEPS